MCIISSSSSVVVVVDSAFGMFRTKKVTNLYHKMSCSEIVQCINCDLIVQNK